MDIRQTRRALNLTQTQLADMTGLSIGTINRAEKTGKITLKNHRIITQKLMDYAANFDTRYFSINNDTNIPSL